MKTKVSTSALFEAAWVRPDAPFMTQWVRPDASFMTTWVIPDSSFISAMMQTSRTLIKCMSVTRYWIYDPFITLWVRWGDELIALWIIPYAPFLTQLVSTCAQFMTSCMGSVDPLMRPWVRAKLMFPLLHLEWHHIFLFFGNMSETKCIFLRHHEWDQVHYLKHHEWIQMFYSLTPWVRPIDQAMAGNMNDIKCFICLNHEWTSQKSWMWPEMFSKGKKFKEIYFAV